MCSKMQIGNIHSFIHSSTPSLMLDGFANLVCFSCVGLDRAGLVGLMWDQMNGEKRKVRVFGPTPPSTDQDTEAHCCGRLDCWEGSLGNAATSLYSKMDYIYHPEQFFKIFKKRQNATDCLHADKYCIKVGLM